VVRRQRHSLTRRTNLGNILKESHAWGWRTFAIDPHPPALSNGAGLVGDAKGRIVCFFGTPRFDLNTRRSVGLTPGRLESLNWQHPADTYEGMTHFSATGPQVGIDRLGQTL